MESGSWRGRRRVGGGLGGDKSRCGGGELGRRWKGAVWP